MHDKLVNSEELCKFLGIARSTLSNWMKEEGFPFIRHKSVLRFSTREVVEWMRGTTNDQPGSSENAFESYS